MQDSLPAVPTMASSRRSPLPGGEMGAALVRHFASSLRPWPRDALDGFAIPEEVSRFLTEHGLPVDPPPPLVRFVPRPQVLLAAGEAPGTRSLVLGRDDSAVLHLREGSAEVMAAVPLPGVVARLSMGADLVRHALRASTRRAYAPPRFVNASALHLLECLRRYADRLAELRGVDEEGALAIGEDLRAEIRLVDPDAVAHAGTWWSRALARVEAGIC